MTPIFLASSDNHLEQRPYVDYPEFHGDSFEAFRQVIEQSILARTPLILAGDVLEKNYPDSVTLKEAFRQIDRMAAERLEVYYIEGQHDYAPRHPWLSLHGWPKKLYPEGCVRIGSHRIAGLDYTPAAQLPARMADIAKDADILVLHQPWREFMGEHLPSDGALAELVPPQIRLVITGDFHQHRPLLASRADGSSFGILSPGSTTLQSVKEDPAKFFYAVMDDLSFSSLPLRGRPVFHDRIQSPAQVDAAIANRLDELGRWRVSPDCALLPASLHTPVWVVYVHALAKEAGEKIRAAAAGKFHLFLRSFGAAPETASSVQKPANHLDFAAAMQVAGTPATTAEGQAALRLWSAKDPASELESIVQAWMAQDCSMETLVSA